MPTARKITITVYAIVLINLVIKFLPYHSRIEETNWPLWYVVATPVAYFATRASREDRIKKRMITLVHPLLTGPYIIVVAFFRSFLWRLEVAEYVSVGVYLALAAISFYDIFIVLKDSRDFPEYYSDRGI